MKKFVLMVLLSITPLCTAGYQVPTLRDTSGVDSLFQGLSDTDRYALQEELNKMSPEEQQAFYQISNEIKQIEQAVEKMTPEEKKIFNETMEKLSQLPEAELERMINGQMSEDEMNTLFSNLFADQQQPQEQSPEPTKPEPEEKPQPTVTSKHQEMLNLIDALISKTESFLLKMSSQPDISGKIVSWVKKGQLMQWETNSWNALRAEIELFVQKLKKAKEQSTDKKQYLYVQSIIDNEPLVNALKMIKDALDTCEDCIEISPFGLEKITPTAKKLIQKILNKFGEAIKKAHVIQDLDAIFTKSESGDKKTTNQEVPLLGRQSQIPASTTVVGGESSSGFPSYNYPSYGYPSYDLGSSSYGAGNSGSSSYNPSFGSGSSSLAQNSQSGKKTPDKEKKETPKGGRPRSGTAPHRDHDHHHDDHAPQTNPRVAAEMKDQLSRFESNLKDAAAAIEKSPALTSMSKHLTNDEAVDVTAANDYLPEAIRKLNGKTNSALDTVKTAQLKAGSLSAQEKERYKKEFKNAFEKYEKEFDAITKEWESIEGDWENLQSTASADKIYAFIGETGASALSPDGKVTRSGKTRSASPGIKRKIAEPRSYAELYNAIKEVKEQIDAFAK